MNQPPTDSESEVKNSPMAFPYRQKVSESDIRYHHETVSQMRKYNRVTIGDITNFLPVISTVCCPDLSMLAKEKDLDELAQLGGIQGILNCLKTSTLTGIWDSPDEISRRQEAFGNNYYVNPCRKSLFGFVWDAFKDPTSLLLLTCAALLLGHGIGKHGPNPKDDLYGGGSIFVAAFLIIFVKSFCNFKQYRSFKELSMIGNRGWIKVRRSFTLQDISTTDIVVGDVVHLKIGDEVPADGILIDGHSLQVDECSLTGETNHLGVNRDQNPFLLSGSRVTDGCATMVVTCVGMNTTRGERMSSICCESTGQTPLQAKLDKWSHIIGAWGLVVSFLLLLMLLVRYFTGNTSDQNGDKEFNGSKTRVDDVINAVVGIIAAAVTIVVVAILKGLPLAVTLTLDYSMKRMMADQALVLNFSACETMGSATTICTDKTGALTLNQMKVTKFWQGKESIEGTNYTSIASNVLELLRQGIGHNTTGSVNKSGTNLEFSGSPTEKAILSWAVLELNMDMEAVKRGCNILQVEPFNSAKKRCGILIKKVEDDTFHVHWKGAAEMVLAMCSHYYDLEGNVKALDEEERMTFAQIIQGMAASGLRCIAFAHKQVPGIGDANEKIQENELTLLGFVGLKDPCRPGVKKAVEDCQYADVKVKMITGDNVFTAKAIATECGILHPNQELNDGSVVEGVEFRNYTEQERMAKVERIRVMARSSPVDKLLMVQCLKNKGHVVAVTGDDTNDAPALKEADIGLSMGIQGAEVAKESSDIVILDDNFATVVTVLRWGRCVYNNIQKFIQFQLTANIAALAISFGVAISTGKTPLTAAQLLWVNLIMDTFGALALATEEPSEMLMNKPPRGRSDQIITSIMWRNIIGQAGYQVAVVLTLMFKADSIFGVHSEVIQTLAFTTFFLLQVFNLFNARELEEKNVFKGILKNKLFLGITGITVILQVVMVEFLNKFAHTERLDWKEWGICIGIAAFSWPVGWLVKLLPVPKRQLLKAHISSTSVDHEIELVAAKTTRQTTLP